MSIFEKRLAFKPFEYPDVTAFKEAIQHSYWLVSEWNFASDVQDFNTRLSAVERNAVKNALLAISQIEVSVKSFWTKLGERFPKPEIEFVGVTFGESECYDDQTEILTEKGWVKFPDLKEGVPVAQFDQETHAITFAVPTDYVRRAYVGKMHHYDSLGTDLMVTPNHELLVMHPQQDVYVKRASSRALYDQYRYPLSGHAVGDDDMVFTDVDRLLIAIQGDGSLFGSCPTGTGRRDVCFNLKKQRKIDELTNLLLRMGIPFESGQREKGFTSINFTLPLCVGDVNDVKSFGYIDLSRVTADYGRAFMSELVKWDGSPSKEGTGFAYYNANEEAVDKVQAIACLCGYSSNKGINRTAEQMMEMPLPGGIKRKSAKTQFALYLHPSAKKKYPTRKEVDYDGTVYCVTVPKGNVVVRRNKRVAISGNCRHSDAYSHLLQVLDLNNDFAQLLTEPVIQGRVDYLQKYLKGRADNSDQNFTLTLALFSIFIENVSLFSQFLIIKSFNKYRNLLKDIDNVVQATAQEELVHAQFGAYLLGIIKTENPDWFNDDFYAKLERACKKAYVAEAGIVDWIFEAGELSFLSKSVVMEFVKDRFNKSMLMVGGRELFEVDKELLAKTSWFDEENNTPINSDFFHKKPTTYSKNMQPITGEDLF